MSEIGDYFNNIAIFGLAMQTPGYDWRHRAVMPAGAVPVVIAPLLRT